MGAETTLSGMVKLDADTSQVNQELDKLAGPDAQRVGKKFGSRFGTAMDKILGQRFRATLRGFGAGGAAVVEVFDQQQREVAQAEKQRVRDEKSEAKEIAKAEKKRKEPAAAAEPEAAAKPAKPPKPAPEIEVPDIATPAQGFVAALKRFAFRLAAVGVVLGGLALAFKAVISRVIAFGRDLAKSSGALAATFAIFDARMQAFRRRLGDQLAPAFERLLMSVTNLLERSFDAIVFIFDKLVGALTFILDNLGTIAAGVAGTVVGGPVGGALAAGIVLLIRAVTDNTAAIREGQDPATGPAILLGDVLRAIRGGAPGIPAMAGAAPLGGDVAGQAALPGLLNEMLAEQAEQRRRIQQQEGAHRMR